MQEAYLTSGEGEFGNKKEEITRDRVAGKVKKTQAAYRKAVDSKRKSGGR